MVIYRVWESLNQNADVVEQLLCGPVIVVLHDGFVQGVLYKQEPSIDVP